MQQLPSTVPVVVEGITYHCKPVVLFVDHGDLEKAKQNGFITNILSRWDAYLNCVKSGNTEWEDRHKAVVENTLLDVLPHGAGIDCKWDIDIGGGPTERKRVQGFNTKTGRNIEQLYTVNSTRVITCRNSYHAMDENGMYDGYYDFTLTIYPRRDAHGHIVWKVGWQERMPARLNPESIKEYMDQCMCDALNQL